jgi:hypothetical protein
MKTIIHSGLSLLVLAFTLGSCNGKKETDEKDKTLLCERIQYDVFIKSPDSNSIERGWWDQNIEGSKREDFVKKFLGLASEGKVKAYDTENKLLTNTEVKNIIEYPEKVSLSDINNPEKMHDTTIVHKLDIQRIYKVRFLEEWNLDEKKMSFDKKVVGMMLMKENPRDSVMYYTPLFWIYFDDKYPAKMK